MSKTALVTGISGFTGPYVAAELQASGYNVQGIGRAGVVPEGVQSHQVDLRDPVALNTIIAKLQPDVVVHLAAIAFVGHKDFADMYLSNILGTRNLLSAVAESGHSVKRVLLASSANIYGTADAAILTEDTPPNPQNDYAVSKCAMEMMARLWMDRVPIIVVRPFNYTGVGQSASFLVPKIVGHFTRREPRIELGNIDVYRDFSDVRTVADSYARLLLKGEPGNTYNVCSGTEYTIQYILDELSSMTGHNIEVAINPEFVRANEIKRLKGCNKRLSSAIGGIKHISLKDTLSWMIEAGNASDSCQ